MLYMVTFTINIPQMLAVSIYTIHGSYGYIYIYIEIKVSEIMQRSSWTSTDNAGPNLLERNHHSNPGPKLLPWRNYIGRSWMCGICSAYPQYESSTAQLIQWFNTVRVVPILPISTQHDISENNITSQHQCMKMLGASQDSSVPQNH
jgi:hypothetical protein